MFREFTVERITRAMHGKTDLAVPELVRRVTIDSRETGPGDLFFALRGKRTDGHNHAADALRQGAVAAVVDRPLATGREIVVSDTLRALGELARCYRNHCPVRTIGITGTNGKTTVRNLVAAILSKEHRVLRAQGNYNSLIGLPLTIFGLQGNEDYLVVEMGTNAAGEIKRLCDIARPETGVITNIGPGHLEGLGSIEGVRKEKLSLVDSLPPNGLCLVGDGVGDLARDRVARFSMSMLERVELTEYGSHFSYQSKAYVTRLLGAANVGNCLAAILLTSMLGVTYPVQRAAVAELKPNAGRLEPLVWDRLLVINDTYNANPASMKTAIDFVGQLKRRKIIVLGDMLELGAQSRKLHEETGAYAAARADLFVTLGQEARYYHGEHFAGANELVRYLSGKIAGNEVVLFKASRALRFENHIRALARVVK
ncbi:UDP-N-acetylmuramoyl-tripeptide--D-alanyl-D-alanine ligase [candidate division WOR-3 bacterium]|nr:UDP-N-acetylmuramoyl-tripeptide--D-alanyl-D-alanine ligase [candidate division WOR-3 bacterium]